MNNTKSSTVAGLLGIFLGSVGAHDFYLGGTHTKKGIIHVCLFGSGLVVEILASAILPSALSFSALLRMAWLFTILGYIATGCMSASGIWGLVDGIRILTKGDAGLAAEGYAVPQPVMQQPQYGQPQQYGQPMQQPASMQPPMQPQQYGQPMQQPGSMQQPMQQPMQPQQNQPAGNPNEPIVPTQMG